MPATLLTSQQIARAGLKATYASAAASMEFVNTGNEVLHVKNGSGVTVTVTIVTQATVDGLAVADRTVTLLTTEEKFIGPFPKSQYNDTSNKVQVTCDPITTVTVALLKQG